MPRRLRPDGRWRSKQRLDLAAVEAHHHLLVGALAEHGDGRGAGPEREQLLQRRGVLADILLDDVDTLGKKELLLTVTGRSASLREQYYLLRHSFPPYSLEWARREKSR